MNDGSNQKKSYFSGECAIVTGASSGIGKEISKILVREYGMLVFGCARNEENLKIAKAEIEEEGNDFGGTFVPYQMDVLDERKVFDLRSHINSHKLNLRLVISNAGQMLPIESFVNNDFAKAEKIVNVNLLGAMNMARVFLPDLERSPVKVGFVIVGSIAGAIHIPGTAVYSASKAGVKAFAECLMNEKKSKKLYVGHMMPGMTNTGLFAKSGRDLPAFVKKYMTPANVMARNIVDAIRKRKKKCVFGVDAKLMRVGKFLLPRSFPKIARKILEKYSVYQ